MKGIERRFVGERRERVEGVGSLRWKERTLKLMREERRRKGSGWSELPAASPHRPRVLIREI